MSGFHGQKSVAKTNLDNLKASNPEIMKRAEQLENENPKLNAAGILTIIENEGLRGAFYMELYRDDECKKFVKHLYAENRETLVQEFDWGFGKGIYKQGYLMQYVGPSSEDWVEAGYLPEKTEEASQ